MPLRVAHAAALKFTQFPAFGEAVGAVVDSGFLHIFGPDERAQFADELATILPTGGR
jgi:hypothetical protein